MKLLIVTGLSGAGKTQALRYFEDAGYFCVDNLPCEMLGGFIELCHKAAPPVERAAVVIDSREQVFRSDAEKVLRTLDRLPVQYRILFWNAGTRSWNADITKREGGIRFQEMCGMASGRNVTCSVCSGIVRIPLSTRRT